MSDGKIGDLERRLLLVENALEDSEGIKRIELAEATFKTVLDADYHLDDKASRILSAMAFFTAAAAAIFAKAYSPALPKDELRLRVGKALSGFAIQGGSSQEAIDSVIGALGNQSVQIFGHELSLIAFLCYMIFAVVSAGFYLAALGPSLNKPSKWLASKAEIKSMLFYDFIAQVDEATWLQKWNAANTPITKLHEEFEGNYIYESHLLAEKARCKFLWLSFGGFFLRLALICLIVLAGSLFTSSGNTVALLSTLGCTMLFAVFAFQNVTNIPKRKPDEPVRFWTILLLVNAGFLFSCSVMIALSAKWKIFLAVGLFALALSTLITVIAQRTKHVAWTRSIFLLVVTLSLLLSGILILIYF